MKTRTIRQKVVFNATPEEVYDLLMQTDKHAAFTGAKAKITNRIGGKFTVWDNYISGKNLLLDRGKKIIQEWWCTDLPEGYITIVTYALISQKNDTTLLEFSQTNVPANIYSSLAKGWEDFYWTPMREFLADKKK